MEKITIAGIEMPRTRTLEIGGAIEAIETTMASGKMVRDVIGYRKTITASYEWVPQATLSGIVTAARAGSYVTILYPDPEDGDSTGLFKIEIGNQKVFRFKDGDPYWYNVELTATAQEVTT